MGYGVWGMGYEVRGTGYRVQGIGFVSEYDEEAWMKGK